MIHPLTELKFISEEKGFGVVAKQFIPKGTITWVQDKLDKVFTSSEIDDLGEEYLEIFETYSFRDNKGHYILCWDHGRFINHSSNSNCLTTPYNFEIAIRDIQVGEELTDDYGYLNIEEPFVGIPEEGCRSVVYPDDILRFYKKWDKDIAEAMKYFNSVEQRLLPFLSEEVKNKVDLILDGKEKMESILNCYYEPNFNCNESL